MKMAVCISGQPRTVEKVWRETYDLFFRNLGDFDIFIHTSQHYPVNSDFFACWQPRVYCVEDQFPHPIAGSRIKDIFLAPNYINQYIQQIYGYKRAWEIKRLYETANNINYDVVVRYRPDARFLKPVTLDMFDLTQINQIPKRDDPPDNEWLKDFFAIGPNHLMEKFFTFYDWLDHGDLSPLYTYNPWKKRHPQDNTLKYWAESLLARYLVAMDCRPVFANTWIEETLVLER